MSDTPIVIMLTSKKKRGHTNLKFLIIHRIKISNFMWFKRQLIQLHRTKTMTSKHGLFKKISF